MYVNSAKQLLKAIRVDKNLLSSEFVGTTNWLYHHDVSAQFGFRHWRRRQNTHLLDVTPMSSVRENTKAMTAITQDITKVRITPLFSELRSTHTFQMTGHQVSQHVILWPLADVFQSIVPPSHPDYHDANYRSELANLEHELESIINGQHVPPSKRLDLTHLPTKTHHEVAVLEIYRLAALIYLERASRNFSGSSPKLETWAGTAFDILKAMGICNYGFPVFIIACEARTDEQRIVVLDCLHQTQSAKSMTGMAIVEKMVQSIWAMDDLETEKELDYMAKMDLVISGCETMPSFA